MSERKNRQILGMLRGRLRFAVAMSLAQVILPGCAAGALGSPERACPGATEMGIERLEKIGIGAWETGAPGEAISRISALGLGWHYVWGPRPLTSSGQAAGMFIPMIWDGHQLVSDPETIPEVAASGAPALHGFNEPDRPDQADMEVEKALACRPALEAAGLRLGSPATLEPRTLGDADTSISMRALQTHREWRSS